MTRRQDHYWHCRSLADLANQFEPALVWKTEIEDDDIGFFGRQQPHRTCGILGFDDPIASSSEAGAQKAADRWLVVDHEGGSSVSPAPRLPEAPRELPTQLAFGW
jgi:hypothetical protein